MLVAKLFGANDVRIVEREIPSISDGEILLKTSTVAICGTDLRMIMNGYEGVDEDNPLTLGHEFSGIINKVGKNVKFYKPGMRVAIQPNAGCGVCDKCVSGNTHLCANYQAFGINIDGGFAEYIRVPSKFIEQGNIMVLNDTISMNVAALLEPMSCVFNGQEQLTINTNDTVLVIGAGPIGIMHALLAKANGAAKVLIHDFSKERLKKCIRIDPSIIPLSGENLREEVMGITGDKGLDVCIVACSSPVAQASSLELMATNGRILFFGGLPAGKDKVSIPTNLIHYKQLKLCGSTRASVMHYRQVAKMVETGNIDLAQIISKRYELKDFLKAIDYVKSANGLKTIIAF